MGGKDAPRRDAGFMRTRPASRIARTPRAIRSARHRYTAGPAAAFAFLGQSSVLSRQRPRKASQRGGRTQIRSQFVRARVFFNPSTRVVRLPAREEDLFMGVGPSFQRAGLPTPVGGMGGWNTHPLSRALTNSEESGTSPRENCWSIICRVTRHGIRTPFSG